MDSLLKDLRYAFRMLIKRPGFTAVAVVSLALGIGANSTVFSIVNALLLRPLPVEDPTRLIAVYTKDARNPGFAPLSHLNWKDLREQNAVFSSLAGYDWAQVSVASGGAEAQLAAAQMVSGDYFTTLGARSAMGRTFAPDEDQVEGAHPVAVLNHTFWRNRLGADPSVVGNKLTINGSPYTVVGVMQPGFSGATVGVQPDLWVPMAMNHQIRSNAATNWYDQRRGLFIFAVGRLKPGVTLEAAQAAMNAIAKHLEELYPEDDKDRGAVTLVPLTEATLGNPQIRGNFVGVSFMLFGIVGSVLLIACFNVANLLLSRATARRKEIAIRLSVGAGRARLVRQLLTESLLLALAGAALGLLLVPVAGKALLASIPRQALPFSTTLDLTPDARVLGFTLLVAVISGLVFGLVPALQSAKPELVSTLKEGGDASLRLGRFLSFRNVLVMVQVGLSLVALVSGGLFLRSFGAAQRSDPGYETGHLLMMSFNVGLQGFDQARGEELFRQVRERVGAVPGVEAACLAQAGPLQGSMLRSVFPEGQESSDTGTFVQVNVVSPEYFTAMGVPLLRGRGFTEADRADTPHVVVVNETMAKKFWPGQDTLGKRFHFHSDPFVSEVVGVAKDIKYNNIGEDPQPYAYEALAQRYVGGMTLVARTTGTPGPLVQTVRREVQGLEKSLPIVNAATAQETLRTSLWVPKLGARLLGFLGLLALGLAAVGIYGVMSYAVGQRSREIGIRMALGARRVDVLGMVLRQGMAVAGAGLLFGLALAFAVTRLLARFLFGISPADPVAFAVTLVILVSVALVANLVPARRATAVDPLRALRYD